MISSWCHLSRLGTWQRLMWLAYSHRFWAQIWGEGAGAINWARENRMPCPVSGWTSGYTWQLLQRMTCDIQKLLFLCKNCPDWKLWLKCPVWLWDGYFTYHISEWTRSHFKFSPVRVLEIWGSPSIQHYWHISTLQYIYHLALSRARF